jgi:DNA polymerase
MIENLLKLKHLYSLKLSGEEYFSGYQKEFKVDSILPNNLSSLRDICINCHLCNLSKTKRNVVFGNGNQNSDIMFVGEAPGESEDNQGYPFIGRAGELLTKMIETTLPLKREDVYISNIVKCRPPNNRTPSLEEAETCKPYILKEIEIVNPKIIVALGKTSFSYLMEDDRAISKVRGKVFDFMNRKLIPTYHPSFLLRNPSKKREAFNDMQLIRSLL